MNLTRSLIWSALLENYTDFGSLEGSRASTLTTCVLAAYEQKDEVQNPWNFVKGWLAASKLPMKTTEEMSK